MQYRRPWLFLGVAAFLALAPALNGCGGDQPVAEGEEESTTASVQLHEALPKGGGRCNTQCNDKRPTTEQRKARAACMKPVWDAIKKTRAELVGRTPTEVKDAIRNLQQERADAIEVCDGPTKAWSACMESCRDEVAVKPL